jgi:hypothetical protein
MSDCCERSLLRLLTPVIGNEPADFRAAAIASVVEGLADALSSLIPLPLYDPEPTSVVRRSNC